MDPWKSTVWMCVSLSLNLYENLVVRMSSLNGRGPSKFSSVFA